MLLHFTESTDLIDSAEMEFRCNNCSNVNQVDVMRFKLTAKYLGLIPIAVSRETALKCPDCLSTYRCNLELDVLAKMTPQDSASKFRLKVGLVPMFLLIVGWLLVLLGPVALCLFVAALCAIPKAAKRRRVFAWIGLGISGSITALIILVVALENM